MHTNQSQITHTCMYIYIYIVYNVYIHIVHLMPLHVAYFTPFAMFMLVQEEQVQEQQEEPQQEVASQLPRPAPRGSKSVPPRRRGQHKKKGPLSLKKGMLGYQPSLSKYIAAGIRRAWQRHCAHNVCIYIYIYVYLPPGRPFQVGLEASKMQGHIPSDATCIAYAMHLSTIHQLQQV
jgi:hypothetical protein